VSERKDVLSACFWFLTMIAYAGYARKPEMWRYIFCTILFCCGLMAKPMLISLPFVLLLMDYWPLGRLDWGHQGGNAVNGIARQRPLAHLLLEKIPFAALAIASTVVTFLAQKRGGAIHEENALSLDMASGVANYLRYLLKMFWPDKLSVYYPYDPAAISPWLVSTALLTLITIAIIVIISARRYPYIPVGWLWYLVTFVPVIGFLRIGEQAMADRYSYIPLIGLFIIIVWGMEDLAERLKITRVAVVMAFIVVLAICSVISNLQARKWHDSITLFSQAVAVTGNNWIAHKNLAAALAKQGNFAEALNHASESLRIRPEPLEFVSQGWLYLQLGNYGKAVESCNDALAMSPVNAKAHFIRGVALIQLRDYRGALADYEVLRNVISPYATQLHDNLNSVGIRTP
jgi:protein O-mannosyl-transferase